VLTICAVADRLHYWFFCELEFDGAAETGAVVYHFLRLCWGDWVVGRGTGVLYYASRSPLRCDVDRNLYDGAEDIPGI
jgi:hypothetical protein